MKKCSKQFSRILAIILSLTVLFISTGTTALAATNDDSNVIKYDYVQTLPDGGKIYTYIIDGVENNFPVPPKGFKPLMATDEELATYGFPPRPTDPKELEAWTQNMAAYKTTPIPEVIKSDVVHGVMIPDNSLKSMKTSPNFIGTVNSQTSSNWSGYMATGGKNAFAQVQGDFVQPTIQSGCINNTAESTWVGLGGSGSGKPLVQTGTAMNTINGARKYYAWYEYLSPAHPNPEIKFTKVTIRPGDRIHCYCSFQRSNNKFNAYVANNTNGTSQSVIVNISAAEYYDGTTAEFINERPTLSNGQSSWYAPLTKYGTTNWTNCQVYKTTSTWTNLASLPHTDIIMTNNGRTLATPSGLSGKNFKSTWNNYN